MTEKKLSRDEVYMLASVGIDFAITQLVDEAKGVHAMIPKTIFRTGGCMFDIKQVLRFHDIIKDV